MRRAAASGYLPRIPQARARVGPALALTPQALFPRGGGFAGGRVDEGDLGGDFFAPGARWGGAGGEGGRTGQGQSPEQCGGDERARHGARECLGHGFLLNVVMNVRRRSYAAPIKKPRAPGGNAG